MNLLSKFTTLIRFKILASILLSFLISTFLLAQDKKTKKAETLFQKAKVLSDSAKYDSAIILFNMASVLYQNKKNIEKYIECRYEIVCQSTRVKVDDELLNTARENVALTYKELGTEHDLTGNCLSALGSVFAYRKQIDSSLHYYNKEKELWECQAQKNKIRIANVSNNLAWMYTEKGDYEKAASLLSLAIKIKIDSLGSEHPDIAKIYTVFGILYSSKGINDSCIFYHSKALKIRAKVYNDDHPVVAESYRNLGIAYKTKGDYKTAMTYYQKALQIWKKHFGEIHRLVALCYNSIGIIHANLGEFELSNEYYNKALEISLKLSSGNQFTIAACYANMGSNYHEYGELGNAMIYAQKAFKLIIDIYGPDNPNTAAFYNNLGAAYVDVFGDYDQALKYYKKSLELKLKTDSNNLILFSDYNNIGAVYRLKGDYELALSYHKTSLDIYLRQNIEMHENIATAYTNIGEIYMLYGDYVKALALFEKVYKIRSELFGPNYFSLDETCLNIGEVYNKLGKLEKEKEYYEKGLQICLDNYGEKSIYTAGIYQALAGNAIDRKDFEEAILLLEKTLNIQHEMYPKEHPDIAVSYTKLGFVYSLLNKHVLSNNYYLKLLGANYIGELSDNLNFNYILDEIQFLESLSELGDLFVKEFKTNKKISSLTEAVRYYQKASLLLDVKIKKGVDIELSAVVLYSLVI